MFLLKNLECYSIVLFPIHFMILFVQYLHRFNAYVTLLSDLFANVFEVTSAVQSVFINNILPLLIC